MQKLLLHCCCAPCTPYVVELLQKEFEPTVFFYNPNIHPHEEYQRRLHELEVYCQKNSIPLVTGTYDVEQWFSLVKGMETQEEGRLRCECCYRMRLEETARAAQDQGARYFATTLTVSPHKKAMTINRIGRETGERFARVFYEADFKKEDGFRKSCALSKHYNFYRQTYCGCVYSTPPRTTRG